VQALRIGFDSQETENGVQLSQNDGYRHICPTQPSPLLLTFEYALQQSGDFLQALIQLKQNMGRQSASRKSSCELLTGYNDIYTS
jgi:hypothetical protein